jgi:hypothetical protein
MVDSKDDKTRQSEIELHPDAWERFTEFVKRTAKAGPQHRTKKSAEKAPAKTRGVVEPAPDSGFGANRDMAGRIIGL